MTRTLVLEGVWITRDRTGRSVRLPRSVAGRCEGARAVMLPGGARAVVLPLCSRFCLPLWLPLWEFPVWDPADGARIQAGWAS